MHEILTPRQMAKAERLLIDEGTVDGDELMLRAGQAVFAELLARFPRATGFDCLCGPGNNGGDGYVVATLLAGQGLDARLFTEAEPMAGSSAERASRQCPLPRRSLSKFTLAPGRVVVDALFGTGLSRPLHGPAREAALACRMAGAVVVSIDIPSGVAGDSGMPLGETFAAQLTVTFQRPKPCHLLEPGRSLCGDLVVADIGIPDRLVAEAGAEGPATTVNHPDVWTPLLPAPGVGVHKYTRGAAIAFTGGVASTGAGRLAALATARSGAGAVTVLSPGSALGVNAAHLTSIMLAPCDGPDGLEACLRDRKVQSAVFGPGFGVGDNAKAMVLALLACARRGGRLQSGIVLDADALTSFANDPSALFVAVPPTVPVLMTPHEGEFARLFPDLGPERSKLERAREAARRSNAIVVLKGSDTIIAHPDGRAAINVNGTPLLATAGSGDVLAGIAAGLLAQGMPGFEAGCAAVWMHAEAARRFGPGLIAEDLPGMLPAVLADLQP